MVKVGDSITFSHDGKEFACEIEKISTDNQFIMVAVEKNILEPRVPYKLSAASRQGLVSGAGVVVKTGERTGESDKKFEYIIKITRPFSVIQTRAHYRQRCSLPAALCEYHNNDYSKPDAHHAFVMDLSAGGAKIVTNALPRKRDVVSVKMKLEGEDLDLFAAVVEARENKEPQARYENVVRIRFTHITEEDKEVISKFIFSEFRKERNKRGQK